MANLFELNAEVRDGTGRGASRHLRRGQKIPAIIYGANQPATPITLEHKLVSKALENDAFYSHILTLHINGEKHQAVLKDIQRHPFKPIIMHMDFLRIDPKEKITMHVPLHFQGEAQAPGVKQGGGIVLHMMTSVEIRCLPADLPEAINVDISHLELDQILHLTDLKLPKGVELTAFAHGEHHDTGVVKIQTPRKEEAPAAPAAEAAPAAAPAPAKEDKTKK